MRYYLPKDHKGQPLSLRCSEVEFTAHVGSGLSIYMRFLKMTGWLFVIATIIAVPQFVANAAGNGLHLNWPWDSTACHESIAGKSGLTRFASQCMSSVGWLFYAVLLGNASFDAVNTFGWMHLVSELLLSTVFCVYVYWMWLYSSQTLAQMEQSRTRASDFAVAVTRLPAQGTGTQSVKSHFSFFGVVASVALSVENQHVLSLLREQHGLRGEWRRLHVRYTRAARATASSCGAPTERMVRDAELALSKLVACQRNLQIARLRANRCTGHAFVTFERKQDAAKCVRHFELIRRHERSRDGISAASVDFRQLFFRTPSGSSHKIDVSRAPEPSDILWENLRFSRLQQRTSNLKTTCVLFLMSCMSTVLIALANINATMYSLGALTTLWSTPVIIAANVLIFILVPQLAIRAERHHFRSALHVHMLLKMVFFQTFNTCATASIFLFLLWRDVKPSDSSFSSCPLPQTPQPLPGELCWGAYGSLDFNGRCVRHWFTTGAIALMNALVGDLTAILGLIELVRPDKLIVRYVIAPRAPSQAEMNQIYALDSEMYLPFRYQLGLKVVFIAIVFCPAIPLLLPFAAIFMFVSYHIDRFNLLRVFKPPPRTTDRTVTMSVLYILPAAVFGHVWMAIFFYSKQVGLAVPLVYYIALFTLAWFVMFRISRELRRQTRGVIKEDAMEMTEMGAEPPCEDDDLADTELRSHSDIELYVPPLTNTLLGSIYQERAATRIPVTQVDSVAHGAYGGSGGTVQGS